MSARGILALIGGLLLGAGLVCGLMPVHVNGVSCGSALHKTTDSSVSDLTTALIADGGGNTSGLATDSADTCDSRISVLRIPTFIAGGVGIVLLIVGAVMGDGGAAERRIDARRLASERES